MPGADQSLTFGAKMRTLREARGVSLRDIAERTKVAVTTLEALERDDISRLPGGIFSRAIVRAYAGAVGGDPEAAVRDFIARFPMDSVTGGSLHHTRHHSVPDTRRRAMPLAIVAVILLPLVAILVWTLFA